MVYHITTLCLIFVLTQNPAVFIGAIEEDGQGFASLAAAKASSPVSISLGLASSPVSTIASLANGSPARTGLNLSSSNVGKFAVNLPMHGTAQITRGISGSAVQTLRKVIVYSEKCSSVVNIVQDVSSNSDGINVDEFDDNFDKFSLKSNGRSTTIRPTNVQANFKDGLMIRQSSNAISGSNVQTKTIIISCSDDGILPRLPTIVQEAASISGSVKQELEAHVVCLRYCDHPVTLNQTANSISGTLAQIATLYFHCPATSQPKFVLHQSTYRPSGTYKKSAVAYHVHTDEIPKLPSGISC